MIYLGPNAFRSAKRGGVFKLGAEEASPATTAPFRTAFLVMMTKPKAVLFFGSILTAFIPADASSWLMLIIALQIGVVAVLLNAFAALFFLTADYARVSGRKLSYVDINRHSFCGIGNPCRLGCTY